jgi:pimeloyl-ACP methyl ester carboxylesterase
MILQVLLLLFALDTAAIERDITVRPGETLRTTTIGHGAETVVLIPGIFGGAFGYRHLTGPLAGLGFRCVVVEPLGFGFSSHPGKGDYSFTAQTERLSLVLDSLGVTRAIVIGQSSGAAIAYRLAISRPDLVRGILSINGGPAESAATPGLKHALRFGGFLTKLFVGSGTLRAKVRGDLVKNSGDTTWVTDAVVERYTAGQATDVKGTINGLRRMSKSVETESLRETLHQTHVPVRLLIGAMPHPSAVTPDQVELLRSALTDFTIDSVAGVGQYIHEEQPSAVLAAFDRLAAITTASSP